MSALSTITGARVVTALSPTQPVDAPGDAPDLAIRLAGDMMATLDADLRIERLARDAEHDELRQGAWHWQEKALAFGSFAASARKSLGWKLGAPMRALRRWLRPRGFDAAALLAWRFVEPIRRGPPNAWKATEPGGQFVVPCYLPSGWVRVRLRLRRLGATKPQPEQAEIVFHGGDWAGEPIWQEQFAWTESLSDQLYVDLPEPAFGVRVQPLRGEGSFAVETFFVEPLSPLAAFASAVASKLKLLSDYRCTWRSFGRAAMLLLRGRFSELRSKTFRGLADARQMKVEDDRAEEVNAAWRRRSLSDQDRQRFDAELRALATAPTLTLVLTVPGMPESTLRLAIESVKRQVYPHWQLIVATTEATLPGARRLLKHFAEDARITVLPPTTGEEGARAAACAAVRTEYAAVLPHGFELVEEALLRLAQRINAGPIPKLVVNSSTNSVGPKLSAKLCLARAADLKADSTDEAITEIDYLPGLLTRPAACLQTVRLVENDMESPAVVGPEWIVTGNLVGISGYDYVVFEIFRGLIGLNRNVHFNGGCSIRPELLLPAMAARVRPKQTTDRELIIAPPFAVPRYGPMKSSVVLSMWESDRLQPNWVNSLNRAGLVIVPSRWGAECFRASGVTTPIEVVPLGCDPLVFHPREEAPKICTFGTAAALVAGGVRKNTALLIDWFQRAFPDDDDVRLRVKVTPKCELPDSDDPRIEIERQFLPPPRLADWYRSLTAFVSISHAEGFGLHLLEAMACGRPVVSPQYSGVTEYFDASVGYPIDHTLVPAECGVYSGRWAEPSEKSTIETIREVYRNLDDANRRGDGAAARARRFTWKDTGRRLVQLLDQFAERDR
jgi:glycosyltransferase involved in cell wall biosynthesis